jgi:phosphoglycerate dehydrogenase-like enzyme
MPAIEWIHQRSAGVEHTMSPTLAAHPSAFTNARGVFSSSLAEYCMMACGYFAKDVPRLMKQKRSANWEKYNVRELRNSTLGVVGYGSIGSACARLAKAYGMRVVALRRDPSKSASDPLVDKCYDTTGAAELFAESDYVVCAAPLTPETRGLVTPEAIAAAKSGCVLINLGRGPVVHEQAMIQALKDGVLRGLALDVFDTEPLPPDHELWKLDNVMISPHNMDQTVSFMQEASQVSKSRIESSKVRFPTSLPCSRCIILISLLLTLPQNFVEELLPLYLSGVEPHDLPNQVDKKLGY